MLSYRHGYHAGNFADVFKHFLLIYLLKELKKNKPFTFIDPFAAAGSYHIKDKFMMKNKEYLNGINKILNSKISDPLINEYLKLVKQVNKNKNIKSIEVYPGSCLFSTLELDKEDKIYLSELHNNEFELLKKNFIDDKRVVCEKKDAYASLSKVISSYEGSRLVLIDPSYEIKNEYEKVLKLINHNHRQFSDVCFMIWYPVLQNEKHIIFENKMKDLNIKNLTHIKIDLKNSLMRMQGTGFFIINSPQNMAENVENSLNEIFQVLKETDEGSRILINQS